jgi:hypothetical protein
MKREVLCLLSLPVYQGIITTGVINKLTHELLFSFEINNRNQ